MFLYQVKISSKCKKTIKFNWPASGINFKLLHTGCPIAHGQTVLFSVFTGSVKCLCVNDSGTWIAAGFSSGFISVLDLRTGILRGQWRAHESEILQVSFIYLF